MSNLSFAGYPSNPKWYLIWKMTVYETKYNGTYRDMSINIHPHKLQGFMGPISETQFRIIKLN